MGKDALIFLLTGVQPAQTTVTSPAQLPDNIDALNMKQLTVYCQENKNAGYSHKIKADLVAHIKQTVKPTLPGSTPSNLAEEE